MAQGPLNLGGAWPVVWRELQEGARKPFNYGLRSFSAAGGIVLLYFFAENSHSTSEMGWVLFSGVHRLLLGMICAFVPAITADCIAREKREGTLDLLFLTSLTAGGIVIGKTAMQAFRTFSMWVAMAPIMVIPFLLGGVSIAEVREAVCLQFCAILLCLAAGLLASSVTKNRTATFLLALVLGFFLVASMVTYIGCGVFLQLSTMYGLEGGLKSWLAGGFGYCTTPRLWILFPSRAFHVGWSSILAHTLVETLVIFLVIIWIAAWSVERSWRDKPPSVRQENLLRRYCTPLFKRWFARQKQRAMDRNPIAWLQQHSWKSRTFRWGLCLAVVIVETVLSTHYVGIETQYMVAVGLTLVLSFIGVSSCVRIKETEMLELILVSPITINRVILGQVLGLWKQFLPATAVFAACYYVIDAIGGEHWSWGSYGSNFLEGRYMKILALGCFFSLPFFTAYFALWLKNTLGAVILSTFGVLLPYIAFGFFGMRLDWTGSFGISLGVCAGLMITAYLRLHRNLSRRTYSF